MPPAKPIGDSTEHLAVHYGATAGLLLNVTFGNAAEHRSTIMLARMNKIELSIGIAAGSSTQIALFVVPILVIAGIAMGQPFTLVFTLFELAAIILNLIVHDGKSNWLEGMILTAVYLIIAIGFFFYFVEVFSLFRPPSIFFVIS